MTDLTDRLHPSTAGKSRINLTDFAHAVAAAQRATTATFDAARTAQTWLLNRAVNLPAGQWRNPDVRDRMATVLANTAVRVHGPGHISATTGTSDDAAIWHYVAHDALTHAVPGATLTMTDAHTWAATWDVTA